MKVKEKLSIVHIICTEINTTKIREQLHCIEEDLDKNIAILHFYNGHRYLLTCNKLNNGHKFDKETGMKI